MAGACSQVDATVEAALCAAAEAAFELMAAEVMLEEAAAAVAAAAVGEDGAAAAEEDEKEEEEEEEEEERKVEGAPDGKGAMDVRAAAPKAWDERVRSAKSEVLPDASNSAAFAASFAPTPGADPAAALACVIPARAPSALDAVPHLPHLRPDDPHAARGARAAGEGVDGGMRGFDFMIDSCNL